MPTDEILAIRERLVDALSPLAVYLFGSYAYGAPDEESDLDFYVVVPDDRADLADASRAAYRAVRGVKRHPVDIVVGTKGRFDERSARPTVEREVAQRGLLLYG
jgi:predicted nucleotidyltransferase